MPYAAAHAIASQCPQDIHRGPRRALGRAECFLRPKHLRQRRRPVTPALLAAAVLREKFGRTIAAANAPHLRFFAHIIYDPDFWLIGIQPALGASAELYSSALPSSSTARSGCPCCRTGWLRLSRRCRGDTTHRSAGSSRRLARVHHGSATSIGVHIRSSGSDATRAEPRDAENPAIASYSYSCVLVAGSLIPTVRQDGF